MSKTQAQHIRQENGYDNNPNYKYRYEHEPKSGYNSKYDHKIKNSSDPKYGHVMRSPDTGMAPGVSSAMKTPMEKQGLIRISNQSQSEMKAPVVVTASTPVHKVMKMVHADRSQESLGDHYGCDSDRNVTPLARRIFTSPDTHPPRHTDSYHYGVQSSRSHHIEQMPSSRRHHYMTGQDHVYHERLRDPSVSRHEVEYHGHYSEIEQKQLQQRRSLSVTPSSARHHSSHHEAKFTSPHPPSLAYYRERNEAIHPDELRERDPRSYRELERAFVPDRKFERKHLRQNSIERGTLELHDHHHSHYLPSTDEPKYARDYRPSEVIPSEVIDNRKPSHPKHSSESQSRTSPHQHHNQHSYDHANEKNDEATQKQAPKGDSENVKNEDPSKTSSTSSTKPNYSNDTESEIRRELNSPVRRSRGTDTDGFNNEKSGRIVSQTASSIYRSSSIDREESDHFLRRSKHHSFHENGPSESMAYQNDADQSRSRYLERSTNHARAPQYQNTESVHNYHRSRYVTLSPTRGAPYHKGLYNGPHPAYEHGHRHDLPMSHMEDKENIEYRNKLKRTSPPYGNPPHYSSQKYHPQHYHEPLHNSTNHKYHHTPSLHTQDHEVKLSASPIERDMSRERDYAPAYYVQDFRPPPYHIEGGLPPPRYREEYRPHHCQYEEEKYYHSRSHRYPRDEEYERYPQNDLHSKHHGYHSNHSPYYHRPRKLSLANNPEEMEDYYSRRDMKELPKQQSQTLSTKVMSKVHSPSLPQSKKRKSEGKTPAAPVSQRKRKKMYSDFVGVTYNKTHAKFQACITHYRKQHYLGRYKLAVDAAKAYDESARLLKGKGWKINFKTEEDYLLAKKKEEEKNTAVSKMGNTEDETMEGKDENIEEIVDENMIEGSEVSTEKKDVVSSSSTPINSEGDTEAGDNLSKKDVESISKPLRPSSQDEKNNESSRLLGEDAHLESDSSANTTPIRTVSKDELSSTDGQSQTKNENSICQSGVISKSDEDIKISSKVYSNDDRKQSMDVTHSSSEMPTPKEEIASKSDVLSHPAASAGKNVGSKETSNTTLGRENEIIALPPVVPPATDKLTICNVSSANQSEPEGPVGPVLQNGTLEAASALMTLIRRNDV